MRTLIKYGRVIDAATGTDRIQDIVIEDGFITEIRPDIQITATEVIDATDCIVMPGLIDLHVHLRDPGFTDKETITTGTMAAARGGFTTVCAMPNTNPPMDTGEKIRAFYERAKEEAKVHVIQFGAMTMGQKGEELADLAGMAEAGCIGVSEDGKSVMDPELCRAAMAEAARLGLGVFDHCEDKKLVKGGVINQVEASERLGLPGISNEVEDSIARRDIEIARETGARLHLCHCSTAGSVELVRKAKEEGLPVTAEVTPHHFTLTTEDIKEDDAVYKMNPPIRTGRDVEALIQGLKDGVIDVIATDHAPHTEEEKRKGMLASPFGITGLETALSLTITELVEPGILTWLDVADRMSLKPAQILGIDRGTLEVGKNADLIVFDPVYAYTAKAEKMLSKGKNSPFIGRKMRGKILYTIVDGKIVYRA